MSGAKATRDVYERGTILFHLMSNRGLTISMAFEQLQRGLRNLNLPLTAHDLRDHLEYLVEKEYLEAKRIRDIPGLRPGGDQLPDFMITVKLTSRGVDLLEGTIQDPGVIVP